MGWVVHIILVIFDDFGIYWYLTLVLDDSECWCFGDFGYLFIELLFW